MTARTCPLPPGYLWWLAAGFLVWCSALVSVYAVHAIGCTFAATDNASEEEGDPRNQGDRLKGAGHLAHVEDHPRERGEPAQDDGPRRVATKWRSGKSRRRGFSSSESARRSGTAAAPGP